MDYSGKTILVVGASGVLGGALTERFASQGAMVLGTASSQESSSRMGISVHSKFVVDLESVQSIQQFCELLNAQQLDGIVLASGRVGFANLDSTSAEQAQRLMQINHLGLTQLVSALKAKLNEGAFVAALTGVVAERSFPGMAAYCASKAALSAWLSSARFELKKQGVATIELRPGHTETGLATRPLFGVAPQMGAGMQASHVVDRIMAAVEARTQLVASTDF
ncbi:SDR family NAD(P)-dependent oxidoreductase [Rhodoluna sp.]|uniref:SDR family NAD(P)-dependent oxidoreductase n=1 Tax=Rhodoluna sp. TaxID=1969481 RepID=UPI0025EB3973|nr:SDR family NAD(P)-dependent oxidoreductase [Rhodoluna sp.]